MREVNHPFGRVRFGAFELDSGAGELRKFGVRIKLQAQPFRIFELLLEKTGEVVSREELKRQIWPDDNFGDFDHGLNKAVNKIREALNDSAANPRFVETVARRGYRFIAEVQRDEASRPSLEPATVSNERSEATPVLAAPPAKFGLRYRLALAMLLGSIVSLVVYWQSPSRPPKPAEIRSLAVLPLDNLSSDPTQEYFADGMTDELITALGSLRGLRVISRTSVTPYKRARKPLREIGRELNIDAVVEGAVLRAGEEVRITARLIRVEADDPLWSRSYQGYVRNMLQLQDQVARDIASHIRVVASNEQVIAADPRPVDPVAYECYLKGRYFWSRRSEPGLQQAIQLFKQAIAKDADYAPSYSGLADSYALMGDWEYGAMPPGQAFPQAKAAAIKALQLNGNLAEAHASLGLCFDLFDWAWAPAESEFKTAIQLNPSYASAHQWYAWHLIMHGRTESGISELKQAERLDPVSLIIGADIADALLIAHQYSESIRQSQKIIEMDSSFAMAHYELGQALLQGGRTEDAVRELKKAIDLSPGNPICMAHLGFAYAKLGRRADAERILDKMKNRSEQNHANAAHVALIYTGLKELDQAFSWLEEAYRQRFNPSLLTRPAFDSLRSDRRFKDLLRRLGLPTS